MDLDAFEDHVEGLAAGADNAIGDVCHVGADEAARAGIASARALHQYQDRTGTLTSRLLVEPQGDAFDMVADTDYAGYVEEGTRPHTIEAVNAEALHWVGSDGRDRFAKRVEHPGTRPYFFMRDAEVVAEQALEAYLVREVPRRVQAVLDGPAVTAAKAGLKTMGALFTRSQRSR